MARLAAAPRLQRATGSTSTTRTITLCTLFVACLYLVLVVAKLTLHDGHPAGFVEVGTPFADGTPLPVGALLVPGNGHDGQFYLRLALDPFSDQVTAHGISLDNPPYRQQRILYPLLAWLLALGDPQRVPAALVAVNYLGLCGLAVLGARLALHFGRHVAWGLFLPLYPGFVITLARDLTEIVAACCLALALLLLLNRRFVLATVCLCAAVLSRETTVLVAACLLLATLSPVARRLWVPRLPWYVATAPLVVFGLWQAALGQRWGTLPLLAGGDNFAAPLSGLAHFVADTAAFAALFPPAALIRGLELVGGAAMASAVMRALPQTRIGRPLQVAWIGYGVLGLLLSYAVWLSDWHVLRALVEWHLLGLLILLAEPRRAAPLPLLASVPLWVWMVQIAASV